VRLMRLLRHRTLLSDKQSSPGGALAIAAGQPLLLA
jgi:hypothetical protein